MGLDSYGENISDEIFPLFYKRGFLKLAPKLAVIFRHLVKGSSFPAYLKLVRWWMKTATLASCKKILGPHSVHVLLDKLWGMQEGAPVHCTTAAKENLLNKFGGRVINSRTRIAWPAYSPDLNLLEFYYWVWENEMYSAKPTTVNQCCEKNVLHSVALNVLKREYLCVQQNEGHFQHLL